MRTKGIPTAASIEAHDNEHGGYWLLTCYMWSPEVVRARIDPLDGGAFVADGRDIDSLADRTWTPVNDEGPLPVAASAASTAPAKEQKGN